MRHYGISETKSVCEPCSPTKAPKPKVFQLGDVVQNIYTKEVFSIGFTVLHYNEVRYGHKIVHGSHSESYSGHELVNYPVVKKVKKAQVKKKK